jgi:TetR/AcrR family transcriptional repressor of nem operon
MRKPNVREELLAAGLETLHNRGFNATSVQDITEAAGVPKGSFYNHFASKEELGSAVVAAYAEKGALRRQSLSDTAIAPLARLRLYFESIVAGARGVGGPGCLLGNFGAELSNQSPAIRAQVGAAYSDWRRALAKVIEEAQRADELPDDSDPNLLAAFVIDAWEGAVLRSKVEQSRAPLEAFLAVAFTKILA